MSFHPDNFAHRIHSRGLAKVDITSTASTLGITEDSAFNLLRDAGVTGRTIKSFKSEQEIDQGFCSRETATKILVRRIIKNK